MNQAYFLAANTKDGFYSQYDNFPPARDDFLHIIKAGPGGGKSGFMRRIGREAEQRGMDVHYVLCSGDPESLDGVYIPELKMAWTDGTSPHVREPGAYAADADYLMLSAFMKGRLTGEEKDYVNLYTSSYKRKYSHAYSLLSSSYSLYEGILERSVDDELKAYISRRIEAILRRNRPTETDATSRSETRFLSCISCKGDYRLDGEISKLCKLIYRLNGSLEQAHFAMDYAAKAAELRGESIIRIPSPLSPDKLTALLLPQSGIAFTDSGWQADKARSINLNREFTDKISRSQKQELKDAEKLRHKINILAFDKLREAKLFHDMLEDVYRPHMDFKALNEFTASEIDRIFN